MRAHHIYHHIHIWVQRQRKYTFLVNSDYICVISQISFNTFHFHFYFFYQNLSYKRGAILPFISISPLPSHNQTNNGSVWIEATTGRTSTSGEILEGSTGGQKRPRQERQRQGKIFSILMITIHIIIINESIMGIFFSRCLGRSATRFKRGL